MKFRLVFLMIILSLVIVYCQWPGDRAPERRSVLVEEPYAKSAYGQAIELGLEYVRTHGDYDEPSWQVYAVLDFLQRRFGLHERYAFERAYLEKYHRDYELDMMSIMGRMVDPSHVVDFERIEKEKNFLVYLMARAMYCDHYPVDEAFINDVLERYDDHLARGTPSYPETHLILSFQWMRELGCIDGFSQIESRWPAFAATLADIVEFAEAEADIAFEAMAFLYYIGYGEYVREEWIETMLALQRPNGAWGYMPHLRDNGHPSVLAVWTLLERALDQQERSPWLSRQ